MREERRPMRRPTRPLSLEVALHMCQAASSGSEVKLWTPMCWDLALYVARLEAFADSITDREAALRIAGATGPLGDPEVSGAAHGVMGRLPTKQEDAVLHHVARAAGKVVVPGKLAEGVAPGVPDPLAPFGRNGDGSPITMDGGA